MKGKYIVGVDLGGTKIAAGLICDGEIIKKIVVPTDANKGKKISMQNLIEAIDVVFDHRVKAIGIGAPAPMDIEKGIIIGPRNLPGWKNVKLREIIEKRFKVKCSVNNDSNCFALAEYVYGIARGSGSMVGVILGTGVGSGIIVDGKLDNGVSSAAGEVGPIPFAGKTIEHFTNSRFIKKKSGKEPEEAAKLARKGNKRMKKVFEDYGKNTAQLLSYFIFTIDPEVIVIGGGLSNTFSLFRKSMMEELKRILSDYKLTYSRLKIEKSKLGDAGILGAGVLVI